MLSDIIVLVGHLLGFENGGFFQRRFTLQSYKGCGDASAYLRRQSSAPLYNKGRQVLMSDGTYIHKRRHLCIYLKYIMSTFMCELAVVNREKLRRYSGAVLECIPSQLAY